MLLAVRERMSQEDTGKQLTTVKARMCNNCLTILLELSNQALSE